VYRFLWHAKSLTASVFAPSTKPIRHLILDIRLSASIEKLHQIGDPMKSREENA